MKAQPQSDPQTRILDAAERAFANHGFDGASLRQIVETARVNLATVYYYFRSKEGLLAAVFDRRFGPVHEEHWQALRRIETEFQGRRAPLKKILEAMILPPLRLASGTSRGEIIMRLIGRIVADPNPRIQELLQRQHKDLRVAYLKAIQRSVPHLPKRDLWWRFELLWGAFVFVLCNPSRIEQITDGVCNPSDSNAVLSQMVAVFSAGFRAPAASRRKSTKARRPKGRSR
ncbi:MAG: TetR/AcrR family transcriptional regulator [Verrucomicrobia bacterium]|nr:TetR/AcrR family transcriptional regulator [Verrucomicrobiota bacterium]